MGKCLSLVHIRFWSPSLLTDCTLPRMKNTLGKSKVPVCDKYFNFLLLSFSLGLARRSPSWGGWPKLHTEAFIHKGIQT